MKKNESSQSEHFSQNVLAIAYS